MIQNLENSMRRNAHKSEETSPENYLMRCRFFRVVESDDVNDAASQTNKTLNGSQEAKNFNFRFRWHFRANLRVYSSDSCTETFLGNFKFFEASKPEFDKTTTSQEC